MAAPPRALHRALAANEALQHTNGVPTGSSRVSEMPAGSVDPRAFSGRRLGPMRFLLPPTLGWVLLAYAALVLASVISYSTLRVRMDREQTLQTERNRLRAVAAVLETGTLAMLSDGVGSAVAGANEIESSGGLDASSDAALSSSLRKLMTGGNYVRSIFLADGQRFVRAGRNDSYESLSSPPAWMTALTSPPTAEQTWVGRPIPDPEQPGATAAQASSPTVIPVARLIQTGRGRRLWAGALLNFDALDALHAQPGTGTTALGLVSSDGTVLVRVAGLVSTRVQVGDNAAGNVLFRQMTTSGADSGTAEGLSPFFATQMIFAYARVNGYPMMMVTCESMATALAPWRDRTTTTVLVTTVLSILVVLMTWLLNHYVRAFFSRETHFRALSNNAAFGVLMLEGDRFVDANETIARMFGLENRDAALGRTPWELSPERQPDGSLSKDAAHQRIAEASAQGRHELRVDPQAPGHGRELSRRGRSHQPAHRANDPHTGCRARPHRAQAGGGATEGERAPLSRTGRLPARGGVRPPGRGAAVRQ